MAARIVATYLLCIRARFGEPRSLDQGRSTTSEVAAMIQTNSARLDEWLCVLYTWRGGTAGGRGGGWRGRRGRGQTAARPSCCAQRASKRGLQAPAPAPAAPRQLPRSRTFRPNRLHSRALPGRPWRLSPVPLLMGMGGEQDRHGPAGPARLVRQARLVRPGCARLRPLSRRRPSGR